MQRVLEVPVGVVMARESVDSPWEDHIWRAEGVFLHAPETSAWRELHRSDTVMHVHAATLMLELHPKETAGYVANLGGDTPSVYVIFRYRLGDQERPVDVALVTASSHEAEAYGQVEEERVGAVAMPDALVALLEAFVAEHHVEEPFVKRQRLRHHRAEEHTFGQEPLVELRRRMAERDKGGGNVQ